MSLKTYLRVHKDAIIHSQNNVARAANNKDVITIVDFSLIFGFMFRKRFLDTASPKRSITEDIDKIGDWTFQAFENCATQFSGKVVLSVPTLCELTIAVLNHRDRIQMEYKALKDNVRRYDDLMRKIHAAPSDAIGTTEVIAAELDELEQCIADAGADSRLKRFVVLAKQGAIRGLGDFVDNKALKPRLAEIAKKGDLVRQLYEKYRKPHHKTRDITQLRDKIDGLNWALSTVFHDLANGGTVWFATPLPHEVYTRQQGAFARSWCVPHAIYAQARATEATCKFEGAASRHVMDWLEVQHSRIQSCLTLMRDAEQAEDLSPYAKVEIRQLHKAFDADFYEPRQAQEPGQTKEDALRSRVASYESLTRLMEQQGEEASTVADDVMDLHPRFSSEDLLHDLGLRSDPQVKRLFRRVALGTAQRARSKSR
ncbi:MAG: hypothetical protein ACREC6_13150 [Hyphomicrobiaceae bacterium]